MRNKIKMFELLNRHRAIVVSGGDWQATGKYDSVSNAQNAYFDVIQWGFEATSVGKETTVYLTDDMINEDDAEVDLVANAVEKTLADVCEGLSREECREECFHIAHDWLIDHRHYEPPVNEEIALTVSERLFA